MENQEMVIDFEEIVIETFANGTIKHETIDELTVLCEYEYNEYKTQQHFEEEKCYIFHDNERLPNPNSAFARLHW